VFTARGFVSGSRSEAIRTRYHRQQIFPMQARAPRPLAHPSPPSAPARRLEQSIPDTAEKGIDPEQIQLAVAQALERERMTSD